MPDDGEHGNGKVMLKPERSCRRFANQNSQPTELYAVGGPVEVRLASRLGFSNALLLDEKALFRGRPTAFRAQTFQGVSRQFDRSYDCQLAADLISSRSQES